MKLHPDAEGSRLVEYNHHHDPKNGEFSSGSGVPVEPGTTAIPPGVVRVYHYTDDLDSVLQNGISRAHAKGSTYGEPNVIWVSTVKPGEHKEYVEFNVKPSEMVQGPDMNYFKDPKTGEYRKATTDSERQSIIDEYQRGGHDSMLNVDSIPPSRLTTYSRPWHTTYRYAMKDPEVLAAFRRGDHDWMVNDARFAPALKAIKAAR